MRTEAKRFGGAAALDATMECTGPNGVRRVVADAFFRSHWETSLRSANLLTAVEFPVWSGACTVQQAMDEICESLSGNICRCSGYQGILHAVRQASGRSRHALDRGPNHRHEHEEPA